MKTRLTIALLAFAVLLGSPAFAQNVAAGEPNACRHRQGPGPAAAEGSIGGQVRGRGLSGTRPWPWTWESRRRSASSGRPPGSSPSRTEGTIGIKEDDKYVLGVKVSFFHRGVAEFSVHPQNPIPVEGIVKTLSVWVVGRNFNHVLKIQFTDYRGQPQELTIGTLNFIGWKKLTVAIPPSILQTEYHYTYRSGIRITGLKIETDPLDSFGTYYVYFDDLRAVTDLFGESKRDSDDMSDGW